MQTRRANTLAACMLAMPLLLLANHLCVLLPGACDVSPAPGRMLAAARHMREAGRAEQHDRPTTPQAVVLRAWRVSNWKMCSTPATRILKNTACEDEPNCMMSRSSALCRYSFGTGRKKCTPRCARRAAPVGLPCAACLRCCTARRPPLVQPGAFPHQIMGPAGKVHMAEGALHDHQSPARVPGMLHAGRHDEGRENRPAGPGRAGRALLMPRMSLAGSRPIGSSIRFTLKKMELPGARVARRVTA